MHKTIILTLVMTAIFFGLTGCHVGGTGRGFPGGGCGSNANYHQAY